MTARSMMTPAVLVVLAAGTAAYAYFVDRGTVSDADRSERSRDVFPSFRVEDVSRLEIDHDGESIVLERSADAGASSAWTMASPLRVRADGASVDLLLRELQMATRLRTVGKEDAVGLDRPRVRGKVRMGPVEYRFAVGADAPRPEGAAYMELEGEGTFVVGRALNVQLQRGADTYRDRALVPYGAGGIARLEVRPAEGASFTLERRGPSFRLAGQQRRASRAGVDRLMAALADGRAESFIDDATADALTQPPAYTVAITPRDAVHTPVELLELRVGRDCPGQPGDVVVVRTFPERVSACTSRTLLEALGVSPESLVDLSPLFARADEIEELRIETVGKPGPRVDIARHGSGWHERAPEDRDLAADETESANALTLALAGARATELLPAGIAGHFEPQARVTSVRTGSETTEVVDVGPDSAAGTTLLRRADDGAMLRVTHAVARRFEPHPVVLRGRAVWNPPLETGAVVGIEDTCGPTAERLDLRDRAWTFRSPSGFAADPTAIADLLASLAHARADGWVAESDDGGFGFDATGACTVTLTLDGPASGDGGSRRVSLAFGAAGDGGVYARTEGDPAVMIAPSVLRDELAHPVIDRSRFQLDSERAATAVVLRDGTRHEVSSDAGSDALALAIAGIYAQAALHPGPAAPAEGFDHPTLEVVARGRSDGGAPTETRIRIGAATQVDGVSSYFARVSGVDATFAIPEARVSAILHAM